jgi:alpha-ketoglutarate-dependent taurine dioxygenase
MEYNPDSQREYILNERAPYLDIKNNLESLLLKINSSADIEQSKEKLAQQFNLFGALVVEFEQEELAREQLLCFKNIFGSTVPHDRADQDMIAEIAVSDNFRGYLGTSNAEHYFHTDGAYDDLPPRATALRCQIPSQQGGATRLVSGEAIYDYLSSTDPKGLQALFAPNALCVERASNKSCQPVFREENGQVTMRYRADHTTTYSEDPAAKSAFDKIKAFLDDPNNYMEFTLRPKQVLITDNTRVLHARTSFPKDEPRKMHRLFFSGDTALQNNLIFGFHQKK